MGFKERLIVRDKVEVCSCGQHKGKGTLSPHQLAQILAWFKDRLPSHLMKEDWKYLETYEQHHGWIGEYIFGKKRSQRRRLV